MSRFDQENSNHNTIDDLQNSNDEKFYEETKRIGGTLAEPSQAPRAQARQPRQRRSDRHREGAKAPVAYQPPAEQRTRAPRAVQEMAMEQGEGQTGEGRRQPPVGVPQSREQGPRQPLSHSQVQQRLYGQGKPNGPQGRRKRVIEEEPDEGRPVAKRRSQPVPAYLQAQDTQPVKTKKGPLPVIVIIFLIIGFLIVGFAIMPKRDTGILGVLNKGKTAVMDTVNRIVGNTKNLLVGEENVPLEVKSFTASTTTGQAPIEIGFTVTTSTSVQGVRLAADQGEVLQGETSRSDNDDSKIWVITLSFAQEAKDTIRVHISDGTQWYDGNQAIALTIEAPAPPQVWNQDGAVVTATLPPQPTSLPEAGEENIAGQNIQPGDLLQPAQSPGAIDEPLHTQPGADIAANLPQQPGQSQGSAGGDVEQTAQGEATPFGGAETVFFDEDPLNDGPLDDELAAVGEGISPADGEETSGTITLGGEEGAQPLLDEEGEEDQGAVFEEEAPTPTPTPIPTAPPQPTPTPMPLMAALAVDGTSPDQLGLTTKVYEGDKSTDNYARSKEISMGAPNEYDKFDNGVTTFRGGPFRQNAAFGTADIQNETMRIAWSVPVGSIDSYSGIYWTGQPAIIQWPKQIREMMKINEEKINKSALKEVIIGAQDGKIYFIDLEDGELTREPLDTRYPLRSSITIHPSSYPLLTVGQGISKLNKGTGKIGYRIYNLIDHEQLLLVNGRDDNAYGSNGAMKGTGVIDRKSDTLIFGGENGLLYTVNLNTSLLLESKKITIEPETVKYRFKAKGQKDGDTAIESSVAVYGQYVYFADGQGILQCVDLNTMQSVWAIDTDDNTDATIALDFDEDGSLGLYTVNTLHKQGKKGVATIRRLDALTGQQVWSAAIDVKYDTKENGGGKASPVVGKNSIDNLVIFTLAKTTETGGKGGQVLALDKKTGNKIWTQDMETFTWSSPVAVYNTQGDAWIVQADSQGMLHLLDGKTGEVLSTLQLEGEVLASPAVYEDTLVIGTTGKDKSYIYGIALE